MCICVQQTKTVGVLRPVHGWLHKIDRQRRSVHRTNWSEPHGFDTKTVRKSERDFGIDSSALSQSAKV